MAKDKTTVRFWLRTDRANKDGTAPVHLVYQIKGERKYYSLPNVRLLSVNWDADEQKAVFREKKSAKAMDPKIDPSLLLIANDIAEINSKLAKTLKNISNIEKRFELDDVAFNCTMVIERLKEIDNPRVKRDEPSVNIADFIDLYIKETMAQRRGTLKEYISVRNHIRRFEVSKKQKLTFDSIDVSQFKSFHNFLLEPYDMVTKTGKKSTVQINNITTAKLLSTLKTLLRRAEDEYDLPVNPKYKKFKNPHPRHDSEFEVIALTQDELDAVTGLDLAVNKRLDQARDIFVFSCHTGLRYSDLRQLRREHIKNDFFIRMASSEKNSKKIEVPLTPVAHAIIQKYAERLMPLPTSATGQIMSSQKLNQYLKEIGELAGIDTPIEVVREFGIEKRGETFKKYELLSIHVGRKTFTSLSLEKGIPLQDVMSLTTHSSFKAVKRYINVTREQKKAQVAKAWGAVQDYNKLKAV